MIAHSVEVSSAAYFSSTNNGIDAGALSFVQYATVYDGTSSTAPIIAIASTSADGGIDFSNPVSFGPNGLYIVPTSSATTSGIVHWF